MTSLASCFQELDQKERIYCENRLAGLSKVASAKAGGWKNAAKMAYEIEKRPHVMNAIVAATQVFADEVGFTRREAHDMLMQAFRNADTAMEQIAAVRELIKLHGVQAPLVVEHEHTHTHEMQLENMPLKELMQLAGSHGLTLEGEFERVADRKRELLEMDGKDADGSTKIPS